MVERLIRFLAWCPAVALAGCATIAGCATVTRGTTEVFVVETEPSGAQVHSSDWSCVSPCEVDVPRRGEFFVTIQLDGYETYVTTVESAAVASSSNVGNAVESVGGILGSAVDSVSGARHAHQPNPLKVKLVKSLGE